MNTQRKPITQEEREAMRERRAKGASLEEIAAEFSCSPITTRKICSNVLPRYSYVSNKLDQGTIDQIVALKRQNVTHEQIASITGVSISSVRKHSPAGAKIKAAASVSAEKPQSPEWQRYPEENAKTPTSWNAEDEKRLFDLLQESCSFRKICEKMQRSYMSVRSKIYHLSRYGESTKTERAVTFKPPPPERLQEEATRTTRVKCLKCLQTFSSYDPRRNRICIRCKGNEDWK